MSDKRMNTDEPGDPRVSAAYREMADERTPEHLDHIILNAARRAAKPRWNKAVAWLRPAAWVATIGLCLAIVVEISLLPDPEPDEPDSLPPPTTTAPAAPATDANRFEKMRPEPRAMQQVQELQELQESDLDRAAGASKPLRQQPASEPAPASFPGTAAAPTRFEQAVTERYCDETATADPNSWLECILELERQGLHEAARLERERLALAFPPPELP
jgi:hypothetical protein